MENGKTKHIVRRVVLLIVLLLLAAAAVLAAWQRRNLQALWLAATTDEQTLADMQEKSEETRQEILERYQVGDVSDYDFPQQDGDLDVETFLSGVSAASGQEDTGGEDGGDTQEDASAVIQQCIAALYALESQYTAKLEAIVQETKAEYRALPEEERTTANKLALVQAKLDLLLAAEAQCDSEVELLLQRIQQELDSQGSDDGLAGELRTAYEDAKAARKAAYLTELYR